MAYSPYHVSTMQNHMSMSSNEPAQAQAAPAVPYSGQWTKEEQDYVAILVEGFKHGSLDIPDGTSLRFFIAAKLGCKPKRVSKKYERTGYNGKQVYRRDTNISEETQKDYSKRLKELEKKFKESRALVVSMQEAKATDTSSSARGASSSATQTSQAAAQTINPNVQALEERLVAMRSQLDRRAAGMMGGFHHRLPQPQQSSRFNSPHGMMLAGAALNTPLSSDVMDAYLMNHRTAANGAFVGGNGAGFSSVLTPTGPPATNKLLLDLYKRRQQLAMANAVMASTNAGVAAATPDPYMMMNQDAFAAMNGNDMMAMMQSNNGHNKRAWEQEEQLPSPDSSYKRARAA
ncbi:expressed unknown protein [Seminavis robusta]|uniref:Uncharacterized protein n=1 Tax=Seminavis robusta TaxID=568900 RepID=A0A9N8ERJ5_9STRA|nr:expressed unknown protein [Seminavis robusta]|eukprot:Sro1459_g274490.1 n/a (346) ;mRNA; r:3285-4437